MQKPQTFELHFRVLGPMLAAYQEIKSMGPEKGQVACCSRALPLVKQAGQAATFNNDHQEACSILKYDVGCDDLASISCNNKEAAVRLIGAMGFEPRALLSSLCHIPIESIPAANASPNLKPPPGNSSNSYDRKTTGYVLIGLIVLFLVFASK